MQNKRIVPRANTFYTFSKDGEKITIVPSFVTKGGSIIFNSVSKQTYSFSLSRFEEMYTHNLVSEKEKIIPFRDGNEFFKNKSVYAVARGRIDNYLTANPNLYKNAIKNYPQAIHKPFDNYFDARDFLSKYNFNDSLNEPLLVKDLSEKEKTLFQLFSCLSENTKDLLIEDAEHYLKQEQEDISFFLNNENF